MKIQTKKVIISIISVIVLIGISLGGVMIYGSTSKAAKGFSIEKDNSRNFAFDSFTATMIDTDGIQNKSVGIYNRADDSITPTNMSKSVPTKQFLADYKASHNNHDPLFKIKTKQFNFDNRYLAAVNPKDWYDFVIWYVGGEKILTDGSVQKVSGHLSFGPEAGSISTFEIVSGIRTLGGSVVLGGRSMVEREIGKITFYPDSFFGSLPLYHEGLFSETTNRLLTKTLITENNLFGVKTKDISLEGVKAYLETINAINNHNAKHQTEISNSDFILQDNTGTPVTIPVGDTFGEKWGSHSMHEYKPYYIEKSNKKFDKNGKEQQLYTIYSELIPWIKDNTPSDNTDNPSLLDKISQKFPELQTRVENGAHFYRKKDGSFGLKESGPYRIILPSEKIGMPLIWASVIPNYEGVGLDFLKYVGVHEYGHHLTLSMAEDISENSILVGQIHSKEPPSSGKIYNIEVLNNYLKSRTPNLRAFPIDAYGFNNIKGNFFRFEFCGVDNVWNDNNECVLKSNPNSPSQSIVVDIEKISGKRDANGHIIEPTIGTDSSGNPIIIGNGYTGYKNQINDTYFPVSQTDYLNSIIPGLTMADLFIINSFDYISGTSNPGMELPFLDKKTTTPTNYNPRDSLYNSNIPNPKWSDIKTLIKELKNSDDEFIFNQVTGHNDYVDYLSTKTTCEPGFYDVGMSFTSYNFKAGCLEYSPIMITKFNDNVNYPNYKTIIEKSLKEYFSELAKVQGYWTIRGQTAFVINQNKKQPTPEDPTFKLPNYIYSYAEVMTRDFVQITLSQDKSTPNNYLKNSPEGLKIYQNESSFEYYVSGLSTIDYAIDPSHKETYKNFFGDAASLISVGAIHERSAYPWTNGANPALLTSDEIKSLSSLAQNLYADYTSQKIILISDLLLGNKYLGNTLSISNGYEKDRQLREAIGWGLYGGANGTSSLNQPANNYWEFLKSIYGIGDRALSGVFREKQSDSIYMYGYISNKDAQIVTSIAFKNKSNGNITYIPIHKGDEVSNLFYLTKQGIADSKHTISDDGYTAWSTDRFSAGTFINELLSKGEYETFFTDKNNQRINLFKPDPSAPKDNPTNTQIQLSLMGSRTHISENGKSWIAAPTFFEKRPDGSEVFIVDKRFNA